MPVSFTLEKRTNLHDECPIRISWSFVGERYQTTMGVSIKKEDWDEKCRLVKADTRNNNGQTADDINFFIKRISAVVMGIEQDCVGSEFIVGKDMMKQAISDALANDIARPEDIVERCVNHISSEPEPTPCYYWNAGKYYQFICDAIHIYPGGGSFKILQELFGRRRRIAVPYERFEKRKDGGMYSYTPFEKVDKEEVFGK